MNGMITSCIFFLNPNYIRQKNSWLFLLLQIHSWFQVEVRHEWSRSDVKCSALQSPHACVPAADSYIVFLRTASLFPVIFFLFLPRLMAQHVQTSLWFHKLQKESSFDLSLQFFIVLWVVDLALWGFLRGRAQQKTEHSVSERSERRNVCIFICFMYTFYTPYEYIPNFHINRHTSRIYLIHIIYIL